MSPSLVCKPPGQIWYDAWSRPTPIRNRSRHQALDLRRPQQHSVFGHPSPTRTVLRWIVQGVLAVAFAASGLVKIVKPQSPDLSLPLVRLIGATEAAAALALILPALDVATVLMPLAATGLAVLMVLAMSYHARRKESMPIAINALLLILAAMVMWGRFGPHAF
jgi:hypothetical protein